MECKTFEIRDRATFIPVLAIRLEPSNEQDRYLLARAGYGREAETQGSYVLLCQVDGGSGHCTSDCYEWGSRTYHVAHDFIVTHWSKLPSGAVVDVEFILGESQKMKRSEAECSPLD
jgi:hypothetical protein